MNIIFVLLLGAVTAFGQTGSGSTNHYEVLKRERMFATAGGFSGATTPAGHSLMAIAKQADAATMFTSLTQEQSPTAQLFGLLGLKTIRSDQFKSALPKLLAHNSRVTVLTGCIAMDQDVASVAREIEAGRWSLGLEVKQVK